MSGGSHPVCLTKEPTENKVIKVSTTANTLPIMPSSQDSWSAQQKLGSLPARKKLLAASKKLVRQRFERKIHGFALSAGDGHFLSLSAVLFLPRRDRVFARREALQAEGAILPGNGVVRSVQHHKVAVHPWMNVALHRNEFGLFVFGVNGLRAGGL